MVWIGTAGSAALGAAALITNQASYNSLSEAVEKDLFCLQETSSYIEQIDSLADMVAQNRRRLDYLLLKPGGLSAALGESCCFYANHSGVVRNSLQELKDFLREKKRHAVE